MNYGGGYGNSMNDKMRRKAGIEKNSGMKRSATNGGNGGKGGAKGGPKRPKAKKGR
jgi:hypothetical protein